MRAFIKHTVLFVLPIVIGLLLVPWNARLRYQELKHDCLNHGIWMYDRIHNNEAPIDVLFLGSSHTINGINDSLIEAQWKGERKVASMGYCRLGRNLSWALLTEVVETKQPQTLVVEVREDEDRYSHPVFPHIAQTKDVLLPNLWLNRDALSDVGTHFTYKAELWQNTLYKTTTPAEMQTRAYGFLDLDGKAPQESLNIQKTWRDDANRDLHMAYPRGYLNRIKTYCDAHDIRLYFLYMPSYRGHQRLPKEVKTYQELGTLLVPDATIYSDKTHWYDPDHLNIPGANALSLWVADQLIMHSEKQQ